ncbi:hypothetical protein ILUMI_05174 [Ignelater luminosus]|uniref:LRRCT domain-containing protein n=1 Tax=Ignelater luminosus TaxID=2038154 RepID=A0A8K0DCF2_IGNLU|nr:hypothetical protein ILUMI_05174 [Ignelater luminosus]
MDETLNKEAFSGHPFEDSLNHLEFLNADIRILTEDSLRGLQVVDTFVFRHNEGFFPLSISEKAFESIKNTVKTLEFHNCLFRPESIINLTGEKGSKLNELIKLDLGINSITEIRNNSFVNAKKISMIYLRASNIGKIEENAFAMASTVTLLDLSNNSLETLPKNTFHSLKNLNPQKLYLGNNPWNCSCELQWLKEYYENTNFVDKVNPPRCGKDDFSDVYFCPNTIPSTFKTETATPTTTTTTKVTTQTHASSIMTTNLPTTERPSEILRILCRNQESSLPPFPKDAKSDFTYEVQVEIKNTNITLKIHELDTEPLLVQITSKEDLSDYHLIWFNANDKSEYGCVTPIVLNQTLEGLSRGTTYAFSLLEIGNKEVSPKSTFCLTIQPEWSIRSWIPNGYQNTIIAGLVCILLFVICLTAYITFICIRRHPRVISSNKSVIIVKSKKDSQSESPPREYEGPAYYEPYLVPSSQGYLTPKFHRYSKVRYRPPLMRSISEWSVSSSTPPSTYADPRQLAGMKMLKLNRNKLNEVENYDDYRPPLPPPNPGSNRPRILQEEDIYSAV